MTPDELKKFHDERLPEIEDYSNTFGEINDYHADELIQAFRAAMAEIERREKAHRGLVRMHGEDLKNWALSVSEKDDAYAEIARLREGLEEAEELIDDIAHTGTDQPPADCGPSEHHYRHILWEIIGRTAQYDKLLKREGEGI